MEKEVLVGLTVEKEPSAIAVEDPALLGIDPDKFKQISSIPGFSLPKVHVIPSAYREQLETLVDELVCELEKRGTSFGDDEYVEKGKYLYCMTSDTYHEFTAVFEKSKGKYNDLRDELVSKYEEFLNDFIKLYSKANGENLERIKGLLPSKEQFESAFKFNLKMRSL